MIVGDCPDNVYLQQDFITTFTSGVLLREQLGILDSPIAVATVMRRLQSYFWGYLNDIISTDTQNLCVLK